MIVGRVDRDDPTRRGYFTERGFVTWQGVRKNLPQIWNEIVGMTRYDIVMMCADDLRFRTTNWDDEVRAVFDHWPDRIGMVYTDDGIHGQALATHSFVSKEFIEAVGYYLPPNLTGDFVDNWLHLLSSEIGRAIYLPRVYIEHLHPLVGKAEMDDTYSYRLVGEGPAKAQAAWDMVLASGEIDRAVEKLREATK